MCTALAEQGISGLLTAFHEQNLHPPLRTTLHSRARPRIKSKTSIMVCQKRKAAARVQTSKAGKAMICSELSCTTRRQPAATRLPPLLHHRPFHPSRHNPTGLQGLIGTAPASVLSKQSTRTFLLIMFWSPKQLTSTWSSL